MPLLLVASSNPGKIAEFSLGVRLWLEQGVHPSNWTVEPVPGIGSLPPCVEDGKSFASNAQKKAIHYSRLASGLGVGLVLGDDSGLEVDALDGAPGVFSRRFAGLHATDAENNIRLLQEMTGVPAAKRGAQFVCVLALARGGQMLAQFRGQVRGVILESPRGTAGFGYDPLFLDPESNQTFAQFPPEEKLQRSHRGQALRAMLEWLAEQPLSEGRES
jgi:XTP/dITP diphosphohydrolase